MDVSDSGQTPQRTYRIVLTEDDEPVRNRLSSLVRGWSGGDLVAVCATLAESIAAIETYTIDLLITDLKLPDGNGIDGIRALRARQPEAEAMVISVLADETTVLDAIEAGATGYVVKHSAAEIVIAAIRMVAAGQVYLDPAVAGKLVTDQAFAAHDRHRRRVAQRLGHDGGQLARSMAAQRGLRVADQSAGRIVGLHQQPDPRRHRIGRLTAERVDQLPYRVVHTGLSTPDTVEVSRCNGGHGGGHGPDRAQRHRQHRDRNVLGCHRWVDGKAPGGCPQVGR